MRTGDSMNVEDVARYLHLGKNTVYQMAKTGQLASYRVGRKLRFSVDDVEAYLANARKPANVEVLATTLAQAPRDAIAEPVENAQAGEPVIGGEGELSNAASFGVVGSSPMRIASNDVVADVLVSCLNAAGTPAVALRRESYTALVNLYAGDADAAVVNLYDHRSNSYNTPYVLRLVPGASVVVVRLCKRAVGFIVAAGNPKKLTSWGALLRDGVRVANRTKGSGSRVLLDEKLRAMEARSENISGYDAPATSAVRAIGRVTAGLADVAIGTQREADRSTGVQFVPLQEEWVDVVIAKNERTRPLIKTVEALAPNGELKSALAAFPDCSTERVGSIIFEN